MPEPEQKEVLPVVKWRNSVWRESEPKLWKGDLGWAGLCMEVVQQWMSVPEQGEEGAQKTCTLLYNVGTQVGWEGLPHEESLKLLQNWEEGV